MKKSDSIAKIAMAIIAAQAEIKNAPKDSINPHFRSKYADLATCMDVIKPVLTKHGLAIMQFPGGLQDIVTVETLVLHSSGEWISCEAMCRPRDMTPQSVGSAITYLRRYGLSIVGLVTDEDDDGNVGQGIASNGKTNGNAKKNEDKNDLPF